MVGDLCFTAAFFSLSLDIIKDLSSLVIHEEFLSEILISLIGACSSTMAENKDDRSLIKSLVHAFFYKEPVYKEPTCRRPKHLKNLYY